jgi:hypothetical protein
MRKNTVKPAIPQVENLARLRDIWKEWQEVRNWDVKDFEIEENGFLIGLCTIKTPLPLTISGSQWDTDVAGLIFDPVPQPVANDPEPARRPGFDPVAIRAHVSLLHELAAGIDGTLVLCVIEEGAATRPERFKVGDEERMFEAIMAFEHHPSVNLYASFAVMRRDLEPGKKGGEADVVAVLAAVGDLDNDKNDRLEIADLPLAPAYVVESSAGNFQPVYPFEKPLSVREAKPILGAFSDGLGGDPGPKDCSHIWRIAGTLNVPTKSKVARGRSPIPQPVRMVKAFDGTRFDPRVILSEFGKRRVEIRPKAATEQAEPGDSRARIDWVGVESAVAVIPADDRATWLQVGMALHWSRRDRARDLWDAWSRSSSKFDAATQEAAWRGFHAERDGNVVKIATLYDLARKHGWTGSRPDPLADLKVVNIEGYPEAFLALAKLPLEERDRARPEFCKTWGIRTGTLDKRLKDYDAAEKDKEDRASAKAFKDATAPHITRLNKDYAFVMEAGKATVFHKKFDPILKRAYYERSSPADFIHAFRNEVIEVAGEKTSLGTLWLNSPKRLQFLGGVIFDPANRNADDTLNLWKGFAVAAKEGSWRLLRDHIRDIVCGGNEVWFDYLLKWMANAIQRPEKQGRVVVVMKGLEGVGKGLLGRAMAHLFGQHGLQISHAKHLIGNFNAHLHDCVFMFADEAFYAGDRAHIGILNKIITEPTLEIERKRYDMVQSPNFLHIMMASNADWVIPASLQARRFFVLNVLATKREDEAYFQEIMNELDNGGYAAMLHELKTLDLTDFDVAKFPKTEALQEQQERSLDFERRWLRTILHRGYIWESKLGLEETFETWHEAATTDLLYKSYEEFCRRHSHRHFLDNRLFGAFLTDVGFTRTQSKSAIHGERVGSFVEERRPAVLWNEKRRHGYQLGALDAARTKFCNETGLKIAWDLPEDADASKEDADASKEDLTPF